MIVALLLAIAGSAHADPRAERKQERKEEREETFVIDAIVIEGLFFTKPHVVTRELLFGEGEKASREQIEESIQRLRNMGIFRIAEYELVDRRIPLPDGTLPDAETEHRVLLITVDERWTLIPFGTFASGGGTFSLTTGIYDVNLLGRYLQAGAQYQRFADTNSFAVWAADPRFLGERLSLSASVAQTNRINVFYDDAGELEGGHLRFRRSANIGLGREWVRWFHTSIGLRFSSDRYSLDAISEELAELESVRGLPEPAHFLTMGLSASVGRIDRDSFLRKGLSVGQSLSIAQQGVGSSISFVDTVSQITGFAILPWRTNVGLRMGLGTTDMDREEYQFFVGGLNVVRGFLHRRFRGSHYWYANGELRVPSIDTRWLVLQHIGFVDATGVADGMHVLGEVDGVASGVGIRILSPKIFSMIARFDYAWSLVGDGRSSLSFGAGQFF